MVRTPARLIRIVGLSAIVVAGACQDSQTLVTPNEEPVEGLTSLLFGGGKGLNPSFDPGVARYSVVADDPAGDSLYVIPSAVSGATIEIDGVPVPSGSAHMEKYVPGRSIRISVEAPSGDPVEYEIVYLPADFPELSTTVNRDTREDGVSYLTVGDWLMIIDDHAVPFFYRREADRVFDFKLHPTGERSYAVRTGVVNAFGLRMHEIVVLGDDFEEVDRVTTVGLNHTDNHDFLIRENGNYVLLAYNGAIEDLTAEGGTAADTVVESVIQEIDRDRNVIFQWSSWPEIPTTEALREWPDYAHVNSVVIDENEDYILSLRGVSQVVKVSRTSASVVWKMGGMSNGFSFVDDPFSHICGQHTASILPDGNLLLFDNGQLCWPEDPSRGDLTRVVEYDLDQVARTATLVWSYSREGAYTRSQGSAQRLPNGNTLVGWGNGPDIMGTEVNPAGEVVWELRGERDGESVLSYRVFRTQR